MSQMIEGSWDNASIERGAMRDLMLFFNVSFVLLLLLSFTGCKPSQDELLDDVQTCVDDADYEGMAVALEKGVRLQYPLAMTRLAAALMSGQHIEPDHARAFDLYHQSAKLGSSCIVVGDAA